MGAGLRAVRGPTQEGLRAAAAPGGFDLASPGTAASQGESRRAAVPVQQWGTLGSVAGTSCSSDGGQPPAQPLPLRYEGKQGTSGDLSHALGKIPD